MKTIRQALIDETLFPIDTRRGLAKIENILIKRGLFGEADMTTETFRSDEWIGAVADSLSAILDAPNWTEADKKVYMYESEKEAIIKKMNKLYAAIGEEDNIIGLPVVYINDF